MLRSINKLIKRFLKWFRYPNCRGCKRGSCYVKIDQDDGFACIQYLNLSKLNRVIK